LADHQSKASAAAHRLQQLEQEQAALEPRLQAMKAELAKIDVEVADRQRAIDSSWSKVAKAKQALEEIRQLVSQ
jgi:peptidoglycan hydrolase CwlO-like protein